MLPLKGSNRLNYVYPLWLNLPENYVIILSTTTWPQVHSFQIERGKAAEIPHVLQLNISLNLVIGIVLNLAWSYSRLQIMGKYSGRCPYIFFTLVSKVCFLLRFKQKWCFKMGLLRSLSLVCTEYLMHRNNTNGVKLEY